MRRKKNQRSGTKPKQELDNPAEKNNGDNSNLPQTEDKGLSQIPFKENCSKMGIAIE